MKPPPPDPSAVNGGRTTSPPDDVEKDFVDLWRNMSSLWGITPAMGEIHGLLFISGEALSMDDIMVRLGISRGSVSTNLARLVEWGLVRRIHRRRDRRDYYESLSDVWEMFTLVAAQRKRREIDPMLNTLRQCARRLSPARAGDEDRRRRVTDLVAFLTLVDGLAQRFFDSHTSLRAAVELLAQEQDPA